MDPIEYIKRKMTQDIESAKKDIEQFTAKLANHPAYALEWSQRSFEAQAKGVVASTVLVWLANPKFTLGSLRDAANDEMRRLTMYPSFSTSVTTNIMHQYKAAAWASLVETLNFL